MLPHNLNGCPSRPAERQTCAVATVVKAQMVAIGRNTLRRFMDLVHHQVIARFGHSCLKPVKAQQLQHPPMGNR
jgi:hypothetical protein